MKKNENVINLTKEQKMNAVAKLKHYLSENFDMDAGNLETEFFLEYITKNIGVFYYNNAVADSLAFINEKTEDLYLLMKDEE